MSPCPPTILHPPHPTGRRLPRSAQMLSLCSRHHSSRFAAVAALHGSAAPLPVAAMPSLRYPTWHAKIHEAASIAASSHGQRAQSPVLSLAPPLIKAVRPSGTAPPNRAANHTRAFTPPPPFRAAASRLGLWRRAASCAPAPPQRPPQMPPQRPPQRPLAAPISAKPLQKAGCAHLPPSACLVASMAFCSAAACESVGCSRSAA